MRAGSQGQPRILCKGKKTRLEKRAGVSQGMSVSGSRDVRIKAWVGGLGKAQVPREAQGHHRWLGGREPDQRPRGSLQDGKTL